MGLINSIKKALDVLDILVFEDIERKGLSLKALSERTSIKPTTLHNILKTMKSCGYIDRTKKNLYVSGKRCMQIGIINKMRNSRELYALLKSEMYALTEKTGESASFYVLHDGERINYTNLQCNNVIKVDYSMLKENNIYEYPSGKLLVAYCSDSEREKIIAKHGYPKHIHTRCELMNELKDIRKQGILKDKTEEGSISSYAVAILAAESLVGSLGVYMPTFRLTEEKEALIINELLNTKKRLERSIAE